MTNRISGPPSSASGSGGGGGGGTGAKKARVLIVNDSATMRMALRLAFLNAPELEVVAEVSDGARALAAVEEHEPDVVLMDVVMPGVDGYEATRRIMEKRPTPIMMISSVVNPRDVHVALEALRAGALALTEAPPSPNDPQYEQRRKYLIRSVSTLARANPSRRISRAPTRTNGNDAGQGASGTSASTASTASTASNASNASIEGPASTAYRAMPQLSRDLSTPVPTSVREVNRETAREAAARLARPKRPASSFSNAPSELVGIAASTGGPTALLEVLRALPKGEAPPILVVQHIARGFGSGLARWLGETTGHPVVLATHGTTPVRGMVYIAPDDVHLGLARNGTLELSDAPPIGYFRPSATHLLRSMAATYGSSTAAVVMTGMGNDGAEGAAILRAAGGHLAVQDEASSIVYGMPAAALQRVPDADVVALSDIADWIRARSQPSPVPLPPRKSGS